MEDITSSPGREGAVLHGTVAGVVADVDLGHPAGDAVRPPVARALRSRQWRL